jgi:hypothetical protein
MSSPQYPKCKPSGGEWHAWIQIGASSKMVAGTFHVPSAESRQNSGIALFESNGQLEGA